MNVRREAALGPRRWKAFSFIS